MAASVPRVLPTPAVVAEYPAGLPPAVLARAVACRDARFDGVFFVGITSTRIYCRPVCPARVSHPSHRRFFATAAAAERAGYRPCLRCRPELAPGRAAVDAVSRVAHVAERRIAAGALNGRRVADLARELGVSERHLRRACERELGVTPLTLAQTHRLLLAKRLLADTGLTVTQVAYASGFQSLRRFNTAFHDAYRMPPSAVRRAGAPRGARRSADAWPDPRVDVTAPDGPPPAEDGWLRLTLAYRPPLAWDATLAFLRADVVEGVDVVVGRRYARAVRIGDRSGVVAAEPAVPSRRLAAERARRVVDGHGHTTAPGSSSLRLAVSLELAPVLMPLLGRVRQLFDLDADPATVDAHLAAAGLADAVTRRPGLRLVGALDPFDLALRVLLRGRAWPCVGRSAAGALRSADPAVSVARALGEPVVGGPPGVERLAPDAARVAEAGVDRLVAVGVRRANAVGAVALARAVADGRMRLEPGADATAARDALAELTGADGDLVAAILARALGWPDALAAGDPALRRAAGVADAAALAARARRWRPWQAYGALHLWQLASELPHATAVDAGPHDRPRIAHGDAPPASAPATSGRRSAPTPGAC